MSGFLRENFRVNAIKVDEAHRIRLRILKPGDYYEPEVRGENEITLRRVPPPGRKLTKAEVLHAIKASPLKFKRSWDQIRQDTREP